MMERDSRVVTGIKEQLQVFERRILRKIFGSICDNGKWRICYNSELYTISTDPDIIKTIKISKLCWTGYIMRTSGPLVLEVGEEEH